MGLTEEQWDTAYTVIKILILLQCIVFLCLYIRSYFQIKKKMNDGGSLYLKLIINASLIFVSTYTVRYTISIITDIVKETDSYNGVYASFDRVMGDFLFTMGHSLFYAIMILRLYFVFRGSVYALSQRAIIAFVTAWSIITIVDAIYFIVARNVDDAHASAIFFFILVWLDVALGIALITVFTQKLTKMGTLYSFFYTLFTPLTAYSIQ